MATPILLLDDDPVQIMALEDILQAVGSHDIASFTRAAPALAFVAQTMPALSFLDVRLAAGDTSEALALHLQAAGAPFVFLTGLQGLGSLDSRLANADHIEKPFESSVIHARLAAYGLIAQA